MSAILSTINLAHFTEPPADLQAFTVSYDVLFNQGILPCLQTQISRRQKCLIRVQSLLTYQASCLSFSMIDEQTTLLTVTPHKKLLVSVSNYYVLVLHSFKAKMKRTFSRTC